MEEARSGISSKVDVFVGSMMTTLKDTLTSSPAHARSPFPSLPMFLYHGSKDAYIEVELRERAQDVQTRIGIGIEWKEYWGIDWEGHRPEIPDEMDDIAAFLAKTIPYLDSTRLAIEQVLVGLLIAFHKQPK